MMPVSSQQQWTVGKVDVDHIVRRHVSMVEKDDDEPGQFNTGFLARHADYDHQWGWSRALWALAQTVIRQGEFVMTDEDTDTYEFYLSFSTGSTLDIPTGWDEHYFYYGVRLYAQQTDRGVFTVTTMYPKGAKRPR